MVKEVMIPFINYIVDENNKLIGYLLRYWYEEDYKKDENLIYLIEYKSIHSYSTHDLYTRKWSSVDEI